MSTLSLEALGLSPDALADRVVDRAAEQLLTRQYIDDDGEATYSGSSEFAQKMREAIRAKIDESIAAVVERAVVPIINSKIETVTLEQTNQWGEKKNPGKVLSFTEYLVDRATEYMLEQVDSNGHSKGEQSYSSYGNKQTRISFLVSKHLASYCEDACKKTVHAANQILCSGVQETVNTKIKEIFGSMTVQVQAMTTKP